jgi:hypothetical protein
MPHLSKDPVAIAEHLLGLVQSIAKPSVDPLIAWNTKIEIQNVCDTLLTGILGPLEQTILMAGASTAYVHISSQNDITNLSESCHESSALHFVTSLGIADMIGDREATLAELSKRADVDPRFLGKQIYRRISI